MPAFEQATEANLDLDALKTKADGITCILKRAGPCVLSQEQVLSLVQLSIKAMTSSFQRREAATEAKAKRKAAGKDDDEDDQFESGQQSEETFHIAVAETAGALMQQHTYKCREIH